MSKTISWPARVTYVFIALALALSLAGLAAVSADPAKESEWDDVSTPSGDGLVVTPGLDILDFDMGPDGEVIYAVVKTVSGCEINSDTYEAEDTILLKSEDSGATWSDITDEVIEEDLEDFFLVAVAPDTADYVVVAGTDMVIGSNDGGDDFTDTVFPDKVGDIDVGDILCLDVSCEVDDEYNIAVGTSTGEVWRYESGGYWGGQWKLAMPEAVEPELGVLWVDDSWTSTDFPSDLTWGENAFGTIQDAITAADPDDTIIVAEGTYTGDLVVNISNLTLKSENGSGSTTIQGVGTKQPDNYYWVIWLDSGATGFTLGGAAGEGFTVLGHTNSRVLLGTTNAPSGVTLSYNTFDTTGETNMAIAVGSLGATDLTISHNTFDLYGDTGIYFDCGDVTNLLIDSNTINGNNCPKWLLWAGNAHVDGATISNNTVNDANVAVRMLSRTNLFENVTFTGNTIDGGYIAIGNGNNDSGDDVITSLSITGNSFTGPAFEQVFFEILGTGGGVDATDIDWATLTVTNNNFDAATGEYAIKNALSGTTLNAENNWWGHASGPYDRTGDDGSYYDPDTGWDCGDLNADGAGDEVSDNVDYCPWLLEAEPDAGATPVEYPTPSVTVGDYPGWVESIKVTSVVFSPNYDGDETILAVTTTADATYLQTGRWDTKEWNDEAGYPFPSAVELVDDGIVAKSSGIALPSDYDGSDSSFRTVFAYVNTEEEPKGYLFRIDRSKVHLCSGGAYDFGPDAIQFTSLAYYGTDTDGKFMLGGQDDSTPSVWQVWRAEDMDFCCPEWSTASKKPTGTDALVAFTPDGKKGYAATKGDESAFSVSLDGNGQYWNQLSLIDTDIDSLSDVAVSADCNTILLFSVNDNGCDSVWFKAEDLPEATEYNDVWLREWCDDLEGDSETGLIRLAPEEEERVFTVYLVDQGTDKVWHNDSSGLTKWIDRHCTRMDDITDLAVESESIIYALGEGGDVSSSTNNGRKWASAVDSKVDGHTIAVLGDYVLVGGLAGEVSYSDDAGDSFTALDDAGTGNVHVAFDSYFADNGVVYAASDSIYRCSDLEDGEWTDFKSANAPYYGIVLDNAAGNPMTDEDTGGVLYAVYEDGMARVLGAADSKTEDYLINGLDGEKFTAEPGALRICGCLTEDSNALLWAINLAVAYDLEEGKNNLFVYEDCLAKAGVELSTVKDEALIPSDPCECCNDKFVLEWDDLCNSSTYELEIALDEDFDFVELDAEPDDEYLLVKDGDLDCNTTYYWRVRVIQADSDAEIIRSWWSDGWSFTVQAGPAAAIQLTAPDSGATDVAIEGVAFTWTSVSAATSYDLALMDSAGKVVSSETGLTGTAYAYPGKLSYDTPYTWKVTAMKDGSVLSESSLSTFRTVPAAAFTCPQCGLSFPTEEALKTHITEAHPAEVPVTPAWVWVVIGLGAVLVITILVLIFRTRRI